MEKSIKSKYTKDGNIELIKIDENIYVVRRACTGNAKSGACNPENLSFNNEEEALDCFNNQN